MRVHTRQRRDIDDVATAALLHFGNRFMTTVEDSKQICFQHRTKIFGRSVLNCFERADAGVVNENVQSTKLFDGVVDQTFDLMVIAYVSLETNYLSQCAEIFAGIINLTINSRRNTNGTAFANQRFGNRVPDAFRSASDDCGFVFEIHPLSKLRLDAGLVRPQPSGAQVRRLNDYDFSFSRSRSFTIFGLALPLEAFITCPTKNPNNASLPERYCSSWFGFAAMT